MNNDITTENFRESFSEILSKYNLSIDSDFIFVDDPHGWALKEGVTGTREGDIAFYSRSKNIIVFKKIIPQAKKTLVLEGTDERIIFINPIVPGFRKSFKVLNTDQKFAEHTLLHEIGHFIEGFDEDAADVFAFGEIGYEVIPKPHEQ